METDDEFDDPSTWGQSPPAMRALAAYLHSHGPSPLEIHPLPFPTGEGHYVVLGNALGTLAVYFVTTEDEPVHELTEWPDELNEWYGPLREH